MATKVVTTRKNHDCDNPECRQVIPKGTQAQTVARQFIGTDGHQYFETYYFHVKCKVWFPEELFPQGES